MNLGYTRRGNTRPPSDVTTMTGTRETQTKSAQMAVGGRSLLLPLLDRKNEKKVTSYSTTNHEYSYTHFTLVKTASMMYKTEDKNIDKQCEINALDTSQHLHEKKALPNLSIVDMLFATFVLNSSYVYVCSSAHQIAALPS